MQAKLLLPLAFAGLIAAQGNPNGTLVPLGNALASQSQLTSFVALLATQPTFLTQLSLAQNVTLLAPSNDAINTFLNGPNATPFNQTTQAGVTALLSYHVLNGTLYDSMITSDSRFVNTALNLAPYSNVTGGQRVQVRRTDGNATFFSGLKDSASVITPNVNFTGGTIHVVNRVLTVPVNDTQTLLDSNLTALVGAIRRANLASSLSSLRDVTLFAPSNEAFNRIGSIEQNLTTDELSSILKYHVVQGEVPLYSSRLSNTSYATLNGSELTISNVSGVLYVNSARVINANILTNNGVVHVIDNVLNPQNTTVRPNPSMQTQAPVFNGATTGQNGVPFTSGVSSQPDVTPTPSAGAGNGNGGNGNGNTPARGAAAPMKTGAVGAAALFGGMALMANL